MSKKERQEIIRRRIANRLLGGSPFIKGDIVQIVQTDHIRKSYYGKMAEVLVERYIDVVPGEKDFPLWVRLHIFTDFHAPHWWLPPKDLKLIKRVEDRRKNEKIPR